METTNPMALLQGFDRSQSSLFPVYIDEMIPGDMEVRKFEAFVRCIHFDELGLQDDSKARDGRPGYDPADLMKLYIYGYLNRIRTSRLLEREFHRFVELIRLLKGFILGDLSRFFNSLIKN